MKRNGHRLSKLIAVVVSLTSIGLLTSTMVSFAWYRLDAFASISNLFITTRAGNDLEVGFRHGDDIIYFEALKEKELSLLDPQFEKNRYLADVSGMFLGSWFNQDTDLGSSFPVLRQAYTAGGPTTITPKAESRFLQFELFFRSSEPCHLYLDPSTSLRNANEEADLLASMRVSFLSEDRYLIAEPKKSDAPTRFGGLLSLHDGNGFFDNVNGREILYGEYTGKPKYLPPIDQNSEVLEEKDAFHAQHQPGVERVDLNSVSFAYERTVALDDLVYSPGSNNKVSFGVVPAKKEYRVVLTIYIEGWDTESIDRHSTGSVQITLSFLGVYDLLGENT